MINKNRKLTILSLFVAIGLVLQYVESKILISTIPGGKLGLCNIISIINIFIFGGANAVLVATLRSVLGAILFGGFMTIPYSVTGTLLSAFAMWGLKRTCYPKVSVIGISMTGAVINNIAQVFVAFLFYNSIYVFSYLPMLLIIGLISGFVTGVATHIFSKRVLSKEIAI